MSITATDLWRMSAMDLAAAIRSRHTSSQEVIQAHLRWIEAVNPSVNAVTAILGEQALEASKAADHAVAADGDLPPLHSVPFTIKENIGVAGTPTAQGAKALATPVGIGDGLPQAAQVIGPRCREDLCFDAAALEDRVGIITPIDPKWLSPDTRGWQS